MGLLICIQYYWYLAFSEPELQAIQDKNAVLTTHTGCREFKCIPLGS